MPRRILHLVGSPTSDAYRELSELYAGGCIAALDDPARYDFVVAHVSPDGAWRFPASLDAAAVASAEPHSLPRAVTVIAGSTIDAALPQMFCERGMTDVRALLDLLGIPYLGNRPFQMALALDKAKAKAIVAAAGVAVPRSQLMRRDDVPTIGLPAVVKPNSADNSDGVTLVTEAGEYREALRTAYEFAPTVIVEAYVPLGREVRCGVLDRRGQLTGLPLEEYFVDTVSRPIRRRVDKLARDAGGTMFLAAKSQRESWIVAHDDPIVPAVHDAARRCHVALGFRQYGLFDFRIDPQGRPWFLEAGPYCSFSPQSVIVTMAAAAGTPLVRLFADAVEDLLAD